MRIDAACDCQHHLPSFIKTETDWKTKNDCLVKQRDDAIPKRKKCLAVSKLGCKVTESKARSGTLVSIGVQDSPGCILCISGCSISPRVPEKIGLDRQTDKKLSYKGSDFYVLRYETPKNTVELRTCFF